MVAEKIRKLREKAERKATAQKAKQRAKARRLERGEPKNLREDLKLAVREGKMTAAEAKKVLKRSGATNTARQSKETAKKAARTADKAVEAVEADKDPSERTPLFGGGGGGGESRRGDSSGGTLFGREKRPDGGQQMR